MLDYVIKNARIIDGTGKPSFIGSVGIQAGKLVMIHGKEKARQVIDAAGRCLAPGFIDAHSHGDILLGTRDSHLFKTNQGITTEIVGQCGDSMAPVNPKYLTEVQDQLSLGTPSFPEDMINWTSFARYLEYADAQPKTTNVKMYIGHSSLRIAVMGMENRPASNQELDTMKGILRESMEAGAAGLSTGLIYTPSCYAEEKEIIELAKVVAPFDGIYASHMRDESNYVVESVKETIDVGRQAGVRVSISHHKMLGKLNWGKQKETLRLIHEANVQGIPVVCDQYPYTRNMTSLNACIPPWHFSKGVGAFVAKLSDPAFRAQLQREITDPATEFDNYYLNAGGWNGVYVSSAPNTPMAEGLSISEYASLTGADPWNAFFDICVQNHCATCAVYSSMCDEDVCEIIQSPYCLVGTDGITRAWHEKGHPRATATFPRAINYFVKEKRILSLEQMIHKMTGLTAQSLLVNNKGVIKDDYDADLVLFDFDRLRDTATYSNPNTLTEGIDAVFVNGQIVYQNQEFTGCYCGKMIRHNA